MTMITKLKYAGVGTEDLLNIYTLYIRSLLEYCSVVWHSTLTAEHIYIVYQDLLEYCSVVCHSTLTAGQKNKLESVQNLCLEIILGSAYEGYESALQCCGLDSIKD
jgi:hypothetical protein